MLTIDEEITVESGIKIEAMTSPFTFYLYVAHKLFLKQLAEVLLFLLSVKLET